jgi:hypothetical protein
MRDMYPCRGSDVKVCAVEEGSDERYPVYECPEDSDAAVECY